MRGPGRKDELRECECGGKEEVGGDIDFSRVGKTSIFHRVIRGR